MQPESFSGMGGRALDPAAVARYAPPLVLLALAGTLTLGLSLRGARQRAASGPGVAFVVPAAREPAADLAVSAARAQVTIALRARRLLLPVDGVRPEDLRDSFAESRVGHAHEAIDILAPRHTPVRAVEDGTIAKLLRGGAGGIALDQYDPAGEICYYYAHLERYAAGVHEGRRVRRGDLLGYVGTSGNAPEGTPHLHFAIYRLRADRGRRRGDAIDPYPVLRAAD